MGAQSRDHPAWRDAALVLQVDPGNPVLARAREERAKKLSSPMPEVTGTPVERAPEAWNEAFGEIAKDRNFDMWGVAEMDPLWVYEEARRATITHHHARLRA